MQVQDILIPGKLFIDKIPMRDVKIDLQIKTRCNFLEKMWFALHIIHANDIQAPVAHTPQQECKKQQTFFQRPAQYLHQCKCLINCPVNSF